MLIEFGHKDTAFLLNNLLFYRLFLMLLCFYDVFF